MAKLYELTEAFKRIENMIDSMEDISEENQELILKALDEVEASIEKKAESVLIIAKQYEADAHFYDEEIKRLTAKKKAAETQAQNLKDYLKHNLIKYEVSKLDTGLFKISIYDHGKGSIEVTDPDKVPAKYKTEVVTIKVDTKALMADWLAAEKEEEESGIPAIFPDGVEKKAPTKAMRIT